MRQEIEAFRKENDMLPQLVSVFYDVQNLRIAIFNRFKATKTNDFAPYIRDLVDMEKDLVDGMKRLLNNHYPISDWILKTKGISISLAGQLVGVIGDIKKFDNVSSLWRYFGLAVVEECETCKKRYWPPDVMAYEIEHTAERLKQQWERKVVKDEKPNFMKKASEMFCHCKNPKPRKTTQRQREGVLADYNPRAKTLAFKIATQFVKQGDKYREVYEYHRRKLEQRHDRAQEVEMKKGRIVKGKEGKVRSTSGTMHIHMDAQRRTVKEFLKDLWVEWRKIEGLPVTQPYAIARLGHTDHSASMTNRELSETSCEPMKM